MRRKGSTLCLISFGLAAFWVPAEAATQLVGKSATCPNAQYTTIASAISAAAPGDEIDICPGLYPEQLLITIPLTLKGITVNGVSRVLLQPANLVALGGLPSEAVITVINTRATIQNLAIDASNNTLSGCNVSLSGIHFLDSTGAIQNNAIFGAQLQKPQSCATLYPGTGFGVLVEADSSCLCRLFPWQVSIDQNSIHDFGRDGILATGVGTNVEVSGNNITGVGPTKGTFQFGVFVALGAVGQITRNFISQEGCGTLASADCFNVRSEGVVLRSAGDGTIVDSNIITTAQFGFFLNGANKAQITNNVIKNISAGSGMQLQSITNSLVAGNTISGVGPINQDAVNDGEGCGINEISGAPPGVTPNSGNTFQNNSINDAYCGVSNVTASTVQSGTYFNTLYPTLNSDQYANIPGPPPTEP